MIDTGTKRAINELIAARASFCVVRLPGCAARLLSSSEQAGFSVIPWPGERIQKVEIPEETPEDLYLHQLEELISILRERGSATGSFHKTVLSRVIGVESAPTDWAAAAEYLWDAHPDTFGYLFNGPDTGAWLGASPEIILRVGVGGDFHTHALAGTVGIGEPWDDKNREEQAIVAQYISEVLRARCSDVVQGPTKSLVFGAIKHLSTPFSGTLAEGVTFSSLVGELAPTPALAGYPKEQAIADIRSIERHPRHVYGGCLAYSCEGESYGYVAIRCVQFDPATGRGAVYSGSGITPQSVPRLELEETRRKACPLLDAIAYGRRAFPTSQGAFHTREAL